ncbi:MAG: TIGR04076 family protein [Candidatus Thorarchaeota archaeon]
MSKIKVTVERIDGHCNLPVLVGDHFFVDGSRLSVPKDSNVCIWALQSMMPVFPIYNVKKNLPDDHWVKSVKHFTCPDPEGRVIFRLEALEE